jgi:hypothetical protein
MTDYEGSAHLRASHQRFLHPRGFGVLERLDLLHWYVGRINRLLYEWTDVANFPKDNDPTLAIDPVLGFEHLLTVDRLLRETLLTMSLDEAARAKLMIFGIADLYDTLSERFGNHRSTGRAYDKTEFFKTLFNTEEGPALIAPRLASLPAPFATYLNDVTAQVYRSTEKAVLDSLWLPGKITPNGILVRSEDLTRENPMSTPSFVANVMRAYRNAHHGYFSADPGSHNRPSRFLFPVDGALPIEMSALPSLWWLAYLADPSLVGWNHLKIGAYD